MNKNLMLFLLWLFLADGIFGAMMKVRLNEKYVDFGFACHMFFSE